VFDKGTNTGTQTDFDGNYSVSADQGDILVFSFIGMETAEYTVKNIDTIDVTMTTDSAQLDEVVVTALGISREKKIIRICHAISRWCRSIRCPYTKLHEFSFW
jgi:hypothetical protein